jgi:hypothetical protein
MAYINYLQFPLFSKRNILFSSLIAIFFTLFILMIYKLWLESLINKLSKKKFLFLVILSVVASAVSAFTITFNVKPLYFLYPKHDLTIELTLKNLAETNDGVSLAYIRNDFRDISFSELDIIGKYEIRADHIYFPPGQSVQINWSGTAGKNLLVTFEPTKFDQIVEIHWDGLKEQIQLMNLQAESVTIQHDFYPPVNEELIIRLLIVPVLFSVFMLVFLGFSSPIPYTFAIFLFWLIILLIYWPGIIGNVNIVAVEEMLAGKLADWHPVIYTILIGTLIRVFSTVSVFLIFQIFALSLVFGWGFAYFEKLGVNRKTLWILTLITALLPANILSIITLTNDIAFSITLTAMTIMVMKIVFSKGLWLEKTGNWVAFVVVSLLSIFFRYNGIPAVGFTLLALLIFIPNQRKILLISTGLIVIIWGLVNGPIFNLIGVNRISEGHLDNILLHHISAQINAGTSLDPGEEKYLNSLYPIEKWDYSCCTNKAMWNKPEFDKVKFHENSATNIKIAADLFLKAPLVEARHILCASDMVWNISGYCAIDHPSIMKNDGLYYWTGSYFPQYQEDSKLPFLVKPVSDFLAFFDNNAWLPKLIWQPAIFLYLSIIFTLIFYFKTRIGKIFLILAPIFGQTAFLFLFNRTQNFRYQYCTVLITLITLGLLFIPSLTIKEKDKES